MRNDTGVGYNQRLFGGSSLRRFLHTQRFIWTRKQIQQLGLRSTRILELGCFDGKMLHYLPDSLQLIDYVGLDANEDGLASAREQWGRDSRTTFKLCRCPDDLPTPTAGQFGLALSLETLEHIEDVRLPEYLKRLQALITGYLLITVPVERHATFAVKHTAKRLLRFYDQSYSRAEVLHSLLGKLDRMHHTDHKGFDDRRLRILVADYFDIVSVSSVWPPYAPIGCAFQIGIVARSA